MTENKGKGLFTNTPLKQGDFIWSEKDLVHKQYTKQELEKLDPDYAKLSYWDGTHFTIDVDDPGNYMNHSCNPNTWWSGNQLVAMRDIQKDEEITFDYATTDIYGINGKSEMPCTCGEEICRKIIRPDDLLTFPKLRKKYTGHLPDYTVKWISAALR